MANFINKNEIEDTIDNMLHRRFCTLDFSLDNATKISDGKITHSIKHSTSDKTEVRARILNYMRDYKVIHIDANTATLEHT